MTPVELEDALRASVTPEDGPLVAFAEAVALYRDARVAGAEPPDDDALRLSWGAYDWNDGEGPRFELELTRQVVAPPPDDPDSFDLRVTRLRCVFSYPREPFARIAEGQVRCASPAEADAFWARAKALPPFAVAGVLRATGAVCVLEELG